MDSDLMALNETKVTSVLTCKIPAAIKGKFILLASENSLNVNQLLSKLVQEAVKKTHEEELMRITDERDSARSTCLELEKQLTEMQTQSVSLQATVETLIKNQKKTTSEFESNRKEVTTLRENFDSSQSQLKMTQKELEQLKSIVLTIKKEKEVFEANGKASEQNFQLSKTLLHNILNKNKEVLSKLKEREKKADFNIRPWVWEILKEVPTKIEHLNKSS